MSNKNSRGEKLGKRQSKPTLGHVELIEKVIRCDEKGELFNKERRSAREAFSI